MEFIFDEPEQTSTKRKPYSSSNTFNNSNMWTASGSSTASSSTARKNVPANVSEVELAPNPRRKRKTAKVNYLKTAKTPKKRKTKKKEKFTWTWNKVGWMICFGLFLRLILMDRGVAHYYQMQEVLKDKKRELEMIVQENAELVTELNQIKVSPVYQKKLAREHLGVIAKDEYLILFAKDGRPRSI